MIVLVLASAMLAASSVLFALVSRGIVDGAVARDRDEVIRHGLGLLGVILGQFFLRLCCKSLAELIRSRLAMCYRANMLHTLLQKEYAGVSRYHSGDLLARMFSDVQVVTNEITTLLPDLVTLLTGLLCALSVLILLDRRFTLLFVAAGIAMFLVTRMFRKKLKRMHREVQEKESRVRSSLQETVESLLIVKVFHAEEKMEQLTQTVQDAHYRAQRKRRSYTIFANAGFSLIFQLGYLYAMLWGAAGIYAGTMTYGTLTAVLQLVNKVQTPFASLSGMMPRLYGMLASAERIMELESLPDEPQAETPLAKDALSAIRFADVSFSYGRTPVLTNVRFTLHPGEFTAVTGLSGGGKSTLFLLLLGAYAPDSGSVLFETRDGGAVCAGKSVRSLFAYVPQGNFLFSGTIRENIAFLREDASDAQILEAARVSCADDFLRELPEGLDTVIGEKGHGLSEGQVQRLAFARAVLSGAPILLLDEATSSVDEQTEARMLQNLSALRDRTCLIVTHRPAALAICTMQLTLRDGVVTQKTLSKENPHA